MNSQLRDNLTNLVYAILGPDPHRGGLAHPDTVEAIVDMVFAMCELSNARPAKYADEPWREQGLAVHTDHAKGHANNARRSTYSEESMQMPWLSDLNQPEIVHCALRAAFALWSHKKGIM